MENIRKIIHVDMDAFYASVEQRENPLLLNKPIVVGGNRERGVVAASSYEARQFGVYSAMPIKVALRKCPELIIINPNFDLYKEVSNNIRKIFLEYTDLVEPLSLDEAYLDVTLNKKNISYATKVAREIKAQIKENLSLIASAGISFNKFLAKMASDQNKPDGFFVIMPEDAIAFIDELPIHKFFGIGNVTAQKMTQMGIKNGKDLRSKELAFLIRNFGKAGQYYYNISRAKDERKVEPKRIRKSLGVETTFDQDLRNTSEILLQIDQLSRTLYNRIIKNSYFGKTITLKIRFSDFKVMSKSKTVTNNIDELKYLKSLAVGLFEQVDLTGKNIRLLGITISNRKSEDETSQLSIEF